MSVNELSFKLNYFSNLLSGQYVSTRILDSSQAGGLRW